MRERPASLLRTVVRRTKLSGLRRGTGRPTAPAAAWPVEEENRAGPAGSPWPVRRYPPPYRAALALSNDTDSVDLDVLLDVHEFVNGTGETAYGEGLGLEVGDSFWTWSFSRHLSLFHGTPFDGDLPPSPETPVLAELARLGWLDTLHGIGNWVVDRSASRDQIARGLDRMRGLGIEPAICVNHGGGPVNMAHSIGGPWGYYQSGDVPTHGAYCLDLLEDAGLRYFWTDVCFELTKFGEHQRFRSQRALNDAVAAHDFRRWFIRRVSYDDPQRVPAFPDASEEQLLELRKAFFNRVLFPVTARDGRRILLFKRFRGELPPNAGNLAQQLSTARLDELEAREAAVVVYQHLGVWNAAGRAKGHPSRRGSVLPVLDEHAVWAFRDLAERQREGRLFVTTARRLLGYLWMRDNVVLEDVPVAEGALVRVHGVECPARGRTAVSADELQGLTFEVPHDLAPFRVEVDGRVLELQRAPHPDDERLALAYMPWERLTYPPPGELRRVVA